ANMTVSPAKPEGAPKIIFAALDAAIARELESQFAAAGCAVVSNSSALRMQADVPLVIPEVNGDHIRLIDKQSWRSQSGGFVVTNPNCSAIGLVLALAPLHRAFTLETVMAVTMQAVRGARHPGQRDSLHRERRREDGRGDAKIAGDAERFAGRPCSLCDERAMQPRGGGRWPHGIGLRPIEEKGRAGGDHLRLE